MSDVMKRIEEKIVVLETMQRQHRMYSWSGDEVLLLLQCLRDGKRFNLEGEEDED